MGKTNYVGSTPVKNPLPVVLTFHQTTAADADPAIYFAVPVRGKVIGMVLTSVANAASGESMVATVKKGTDTIAAATIDDSVTAIYQVGNSAFSAVVPGDILELELDYTAGGGPTPVTDTVVSILIEPKSM